MIGLAYRSGDGKRATVVSVAPFTPPTEHRSDPPKRKRGRPPKVK